MRRFAPLVLVAVAGCASGTSAGGAGVGAPIQSIGMAGSNDRLTIAPGSGPHLNTLDAAVDAVWRVLPAAFDSVSIPVVRMDAANKLIGNDAFKTRQRLGKVALSRYVDCGQTQIGPNADSYEVVLTLVVQVRAASATTSSLTTTFEANSRPIAFSQGYSRCTPSGSLEAKLLAAIKAQLKR